MPAQGRNILYIYLSEHATSSRSSWLYVFSVLSASYGRLDCYFYCGNGRYRFRIKRNRKGEKTNFLHCFFTTISLLSFVDVLKRLDELSELLMTEKEITAMYSNRKTPGN